MAHSDPNPSPIRRALLDRIAATPLDRSHRPVRHEAGDVLDVEVTGVHPMGTAQVSLELAKFIGGGFAGQVYQARIRSITGSVAGLAAGGTYAVKILRPPSAFSVAFRDALYKLAYQGAFSAQVDEHAVLAGAMWQKLIRRATKLELGDDHMVVDVFGVFFDETMRSWAEISEWVPGRTWLLEIDDRVFSRAGHKAHAWDDFRTDVHSPEYLNKRSFMARFVRLLHEMGAPELARQYEWWSLKSQPNVLKRLSAGTGPADGLTAIDFRAGLALLPCLPMSPVDFALIVRGLARGALVQFDRGDLAQLTRYVQRRRERFADLMPLLESLKVQDAEYRSSLLDLTHHHVRVLTEPDLRSSVRAGLIRDWHTLEHVDDAHAERLHASTFAFVLCFLLGFLPLLGPGLRKLWGHDRKRRHLVRCLSDWGYFMQTLRVRQWESLVEWHRVERVDDARAVSLADRPGAFYLQALLLGWLPAKLHRYLADPPLLWDRIKHAVTYPVRLYLYPDVREAWLLEQVESAKAEGMLDEAEEQRIRSSIKDPFIQTYLKCVAVHFCTLPATQLVSVAVALWYMVFGGQNWEQSMAGAALILAAFQATPISPGSTLRGLYVLYRIIRDRNIKDYWVAMLISFWHYVGYLSFPIQMVARFPGLARFMGGSWATKMARLIPVFGEKGALLEHLVFDAFFNVPITLRRLLTFWKKTP